MEINKVKEKMTDLLSGVFDGATIMVGAFREKTKTIIWRSKTKSSDRKSNNKKSKNIFI